MADPRAERRIALGTLILGVAGFVLVATWLVPWDPVPGGEPTPVAAGSVFGRSQIARAEYFSNAARWWSWR